MLWQVIYSSKVSQPLGSADLEQLLVAARTSNEACGVTGVLIYVDGVFVQVLEGDRATLDELVAGIRDDVRHEAMTVFHDAEIGERAFRDWRMAFLSPDLAQLSRWADLQGTRSIQELLTHVYRDPHRVPRILISIVKAIAEQARRG